MIKIIAGKRKGWYIKTPSKDSKVKPLSAQIKKSLFDILKNKIFNCNFLDLYAGCGTVGLEALSRGAKNVTFVDKSFFAYKLIKQNIEKLKFENASVFCRNILEGLFFIKEKFDIIFCGPPYRIGNFYYMIDKTIEKINESKIYKRNTLLIIQHFYKINLDDFSGWKLLEKRKYGDTTLSFYKRND